MEVPSYIIPYIRIEIGGWGDKQIKKASEITVTVKSPRGEIDKKKTLQEWLDEHKLISKDGSMTTLIKPLNVDKELIERVVSLSWIK